MAKSILDKYKSIDQTKISKEAKTILLKIKVKTRNFKETTPETNKVFNAFYTKIQESKPQAIKGYKAPSKPTSKPSSNRLSAAELLKQAKKRRANQGISTSKSDIEKDAVRPAKPKGYRITDGTNYPYVKGNKYWEGRENRLDRKQPPKKYPKLEHGGYMAKGGKTKEDDKDITLHLYYHKTGGGAEYLGNIPVTGTKEASFQSEYVIRIDGAKTHGGEFRLPNGKMIKLYYHETSGGAKYLCSKKVQGSKDEGSFNSKYIVRIDGASKGHGELFIRDYQKHEDGGMMAKGGGIYSSDDRWVVTFENQDSGEFEKVIVRANNKQNAIAIAEDESGLSGDWQYHSAEKEMAHGGYMAKGGVIYLESVGTYFKPSDMTVSPMQDFKNEGEITHISDVDEEWVDGLSEKDKTTIEKYKAKGRMMASGGMMADGGYMANGGKTEGVKWHKYENNVYEAELGNCDIRISPDTQKGYWSVYVKEGKKSIGQAHEVYGIDNAKDKAYSIVKSQYMADGGYMAKGGEVDNYQKFDFNSKGNFASEIDGKKYEIIYRDDKTKLYDLFENGKKIKSSKSIRDVFTFSNGGYMADGGETHRMQDPNFFAEGGEISEGNLEMVMSNTKAIKHHASELENIINMNTPIEGWVVAKLERAETDLSDVTHYIDGLSTK